MKSYSLFLPLLAATSAYAHGFLAAVIIEGKEYLGDLPSGVDNPSIIRQVSDISPVKGADNPDINCGLSAHSPAALVANANPGDTISFDWKGGETGALTWPHNTGPMLTYMASCGSQSCNQYNSTPALWFKIQEVGQLPNGSWAQAALMLGLPANITLPSNIAPGNYLIRHELIALQLAMSMGGAEFYPACSQLQVGGSGTGKPTASELVTFPGGYQDNDPGIYDPTVYDPGSNYTFPGPPIAAFVGASAGGDSGSSDNGGGSSSGSGGSAGGTSSSDGGANPALQGVQTQCTLQRPLSLGQSYNARRSFGSLNVKHYPKHISRVMRNFIFGRRH